MATLTRPVTHTDALPAWLRHYWLVGTAFSLVLLLGLPTLIVPLYTDQTVFALAARTILAGGVPYRDLWDIKPPGIYFVYTLAFLPFGEHMVSVRILDLANTALAMVALFLLGRRLFGERAGVLAGCLYGVTYLTRAGFEGLGQTESFLAAPVAFAVLLYQPSERHAPNRRAAASGLLLGLAFSIKSSAAFFILALPAMELMFGQRPWQIAPAVRRLSLAAAAFLAVPAAFAVYLAAGGALGDFIDIQRLHVTHYTALHWSPPGESYLHFLGRTTDEYLKHNLFLTIPAGVAVFFALRGARRAGTALAALLLAGALLGVWAQGKFYSYHWLALVFPLALLAGFAIDGVLTSFHEPSHPGKQWLAAAFVGASLIALTPSLVGNPVDQYHHFISYATGSISDEENEAAFSPFLKDNHQLVDYVKAHSAEGEGFFIWGNWPVAYWWADRPLASRFVYDTALSSAWAPEVWRRELVDTLTKNPPPYVVIAHAGSQPWLLGTDKPSDQQLAGYPEFASFLNREYALLWNGQLFELYTRK